MTDNKEEPASAPEEAGRAADAAAAEPFLALARLGKEKWNRWIRTVVDEDEDGATTLRLEKIERLGDDELKQLLVDAGIEAPPVIGQVGEEWRRVVFDGVDFTKIENPPNFEGFYFPSRASFTKARFDNIVDFKGACFGNMASFDGASIGGGTRFKAGGTSFKGARFGDQASFDGASFSGEADFEGASFGDMARFEGASFGGVARFDGACFLGMPGFYSASFRGARFGNRAEFDGVRFHYSTDFQGASFDDYTHFEGANFCGPVLFGAVEDTTRRRELSSIAKRLELDASSFVELRVDQSPGDLFNDLSFDSARFGDIADFTGRRFRGSLSLRNAKFGSVPELRNTEGVGNIDASGMQVSFGGGVRRHWTTDSQVSTRLRQLRKIMEEIKAHDIERDLFILEKKADRGVLWEFGGWRNRWKSIVWTVLLAVYGALSDCGRSILRPLVWLGLSWLGFLALYHCLIAGSRPWFDAELVSFTLGNMLPFVSGLSPARKDVLFLLFGTRDPLSDTWIIVIPTMVELLIRR